MRFPSTSILLLLGLTLSTATSVELLHDEQYGQLVGRQDSVAAAKEQQAGRLQLLGTLPKCGLICLETVIAASPCPFTDAACSCRNATIAEEIQTCVLRSCTVKESLTTKNVTMAVCGQEMRDRTGLAMSSGVGGLVFALVAYTVRIASKVDFTLSNAHPGASNFWLDDFAITLAVIIVTTFSAITVPLANIGFGKDIWTVEFPKITKILKLFFAEEMLYVSGLGIVKISMLLTYLRFFSSPTFRKAVFVLIVLNAIYVVVFMSMVALQCRPLSYTWHRWDGEHEGSCLKFASLAWPAAAFNIILDAATLTLPIRELWKMSLNKRKKIGVVLMFSVGFFITIVSILRLYSLVAYSSDSNFTWAFVIPGVWSKIELHGSVVCACMPAIRQFFRRFTPRLLGSTVGSNTGATTDMSGSRTAVATHSTKFSNFSKSDDTEAFVELVDVNINDDASDKHKH
ncbi:SAT4 family membrane protein [Sphaerulina musiva]